MTLFLCIVFHLLQHSTVVEYAARPTTLLLRLNGKLPCHKFLGCESSFVFVMLSYQDNARLFSRGSRKFHCQVSRRLILFLFARTSRQLDGSQSYLAGLGFHFMLLKIASRNLDLSAGSSFGTSNFPTRFEFVDATVVQKVIVVGGRSTLRVEISDVVLLLIAPAAVDASGVARAVSVGRWTAWSIEAETKTGHRCQGSGLSCFIAAATDLSPCEPPTIFPLSTLSLYCHPEKSK